jgi:DHA1 family multidrug resistance protein-like MFS transporter
MILPELDAGHWRATVSIAVATGMGTLSFSFWWPFMPLFLLDELGAKSEAEAVFWVAAATTAQGVARLIVGPFWGILSDRYGRKIMLLRALYFASGTTLIAALINEPWQVAIAFTFQGIFSGFVPAAVALTSVSVPDSRLNSSLSLVTGAQYLGNTVGPAIGAGLAVLLGFRGAIFVAALLPAIAATAVLFFVPKDKVGREAPSEAAGEDQPALEPFSKSLSLQFAIAVFLSFLLFALTQLLGLVTPVALKQLQEEGVAGNTGIAFTLAGLASTVGVLVLARGFFKPGQLKMALVVSSVLTGGAHLLLAAVNTVALYIFAFSLISLLRAAMIPASNTLIAASVSRERRGTAFGVASSAQAIAFMVGPMGAALFAAVSLDLGFVIIGGIFIALAVVLLAFLREPRLEAEVSAPVVQA